jgi:GNAT superfamily N-acetyltransferase
MTESDASAVSRIVAACYRLLAEREGFSREQLDRLLAERSAEAVVRKGWLRQWDCYVAQTGGGLVGALAIEGNEIAELFVSPEHHRQGVGTALFRAAERRMAAEGHHTLTLRSAARSARPFYEAMGLEVVDTRPCPFGPLAGWPLTFYGKDIQPMGDATSTSGRPCDTRDR